VSAPDAVVIADPFDSIVTISTPWAELTMPASTQRCTFARH
jgi:hypothetical protein